MILFFFNLLLFGCSAATLEQGVAQVDQPLKASCDQPMCDGPLSDIFCHGEMLHLSWSFGLQKTCPGNKLRFDAPEVLDNFARLKYPVKREEFQMFCEQNFEMVNLTMIVNVSPLPVYVSYFNDIHNPKHLQLAMEINRRWEGRQYRPEVLENPQRYPAWSVPHEFTVPGGRFDTYYYWDSYWMIIGLARSQITDTSFDMLKNFIHLIETYGYVPNSGHIQMSKRSQPPLFTHMIDAHYQASGHILRTWLPIAEKELHFWETHRTVTFGNRTMFLYKAPTNCPRPENYLEDYNRGMKTADPESTWKGIASACESGWDFSSRWISNSTTKIMRADRIVPVDLNVFMARSYYILHQLYSLYGFDVEAKKNFKKYETLAKSIHSLFWNSKKNSWFDYNLDTNAQKEEFYVSNLYPLLLPALSKYAEKTIPVVRKVASYDGAVPTSLMSSGEQWDYPNAWAPTQHLFIQSLRASNNSVLQKIATEQSLKFIDMVYNGVFNPPQGTNGSIWEKYDARSPKGLPGLGGEYKTQQGFGWTNGAVIDLIWQVRKVFPKPKELIIKETIVDRERKASKNTLAVVFLLFLVTGGIVIFYIVEGQRNSHRVYVDPAPFAYNRL